MADKHLFFDMDDTLIKCSGYFYDVEDIVANKILEYTDKYTFEELKIFDSSYENYPSEF